MLVGTRDACNAMESLPYHKRSPRNPAAAHLGLVITREHAGVVHVQDVQLPVTQGQLVLRRGTQRVGHNA